MMKLAALVRRAAVVVGTVGALLVTGSVAYAGPVAVAGENGLCVANLTSGEFRCYESGEVMAPAGAAVALMDAYENINYGGRALQFQASNSCTTAYDNELNKKFGDLNDWSNRISSWRTYDTCRVRFWDGPNFGPPMSDLSHHYVDCPDMRTCFGSTNWNDRPSSLALT